ncbi:cyclic nucleotide-binding domain-containing protein [Haematococcus lacustris]|uniref:Cyclic nucleotide-binding domain-containing protein n=1 Tax=Haematococcus lacustris TaxID=44745 RepID=A0A699YWD8_HAELA|nr:cyclic nucleotide-binding domain-containing protein [Haematococcus lacustris]
MLSMLAQGGFFGELALLATARRTAHCTALQNCDLSLLMAGDLVAAMRDFPDSAALTAGTVGEQSRQTVAPAHLRKLNPDAANNMDR